MATKEEWVAIVKAEHPTIKKMVNGVTSEMSASEYEATIDDWATHRAANEVREEVIANGGQSANYASFRKDSMIDGSYPSIGDQLEMLFHDITNGKLGKTGSWYKAVKATKDKFTKP